MAKRATASSSTRSRQRARIRTIHKRYREAYERIADKDPYDDLSRKLCLEDIEEGTFSSAKRVSGAPSPIASHHGVLGTVRLLDGDAGGWEEIDRAFCFRAWAARYKMGVVLEAHRRGDTTGAATWLLFGVCDYASTLCHAYATGQDELHRHVSDLWRGLAHTPAVFKNDEAFWEGGGQGHIHYEPFCLRLFREGTTDPAWELPELILQKDMGPFAPILEHWEEGGEPLAVALLGALDYHCRNLDDNGGPRTPWAPFQKSPFALLPGVAVGD